MYAPAPSTSLLRRAVIVGIGVAAGVLLGRMLWPFLPALASSAAIALLVFPLYRRYERRLGHRSIAAFTATALIFLLGVVPAFALGLVLVNEIAQGLEWLQRDAGRIWSADGPVGRWLGGMAPTFGLEPAAVTAAVGDQLGEMARRLVDRGFLFLTEMGRWLLQASAALFSLYYMLKDGDTIVAFVKRLLPLESAQTDRLFRRAGEVTRATLYGNVLVALVQGALGGLAFALLGIPGAALWGTLMAMLSLLPVIGPPVVWLPAVAILLLDGRPLAGIALLAFGVLVISTIDNVLRAILVSDRAQLHPLVVFFSVLGGLVVFGGAGILIGPVLFIAAYMLVEIALDALDGDGTAALDPYDARAPGAALR